MHARVRGVAQAADSWRCRGSHRRVARAHVGSLAFLGDKTEVAVVVVGHKATNNAVADDAASKGHEGLFAHINVLGRDAGEGQMGAFTGAGAARSVACTLLCARWVSTGRQLCRSWEKACLTAPADERTGGCTIFWTALFLTAGLEEARLETVAAIDAALALGDTGAGAVDRCSKSSCWADAMTVAFDLISSRADAWRDRVSDNALKTIDQERGGRVCRKNSVLLLTAGDTTASLAGSGKQPTIGDVEMLKDGITNVGGCEVTAALAGDAEMGGAPADRAMLKDMGAKLISAHQALEEAEAPRAKPTPKPTAHKTRLQLGPHVELDVCMYKNIAREGFPTMKAHYETAAKEVGATGKITKETEYYRKDAGIEDEYKPLEKEDMVQGYKYGHQLVPLGEEQEAALDFSGGPASLKLLGFVEPSCLPLSHAYPEPQLVVAPPGDNRSAMALSALARALDDEGTHAALRFVRKDGAQPQLCAAVPALAEGANKAISPDALLLYKLPFADAIRFFRHPLQLNEKGEDPSAEQVAAADVLVGALTLPDGEGPTCASAFNPCIRRLYEKVLDGGLDDDGAGISGARANDAWVIASVMRGAQAAVDADAVKAAAARFGEACPVRARKRKATEGPEDEQKEQAQAGAAGGRAGAKPAASGPSTPAVQVKREADLVVIGRRDPVGDFEAALAGGASAERVSAALAKGHEVVVTLANDGSAEFTRAGGLLAALRKASVTAGCTPVAAYNAFISDVVAPNFSQGRKQKFWAEQVVGAKAGPITKLEAEGGCSADEAKAVLEGGVGAKPLEEAVAPAEDMDEDLADMV